MRTWAVIGAVLGFLAVLPAGAFVIDNFDVDIEIRPDSSILVKERIGVDFGSEYKHGIYRFIPVKYERKGLTYKMRLRFLSATDENGRSYKYKVSGWGRNREIKIGDPDVTITGRHTYVIEYEVRRAINFFENHDELYWNVTGTEWPTDIAAVRALVRLPAGVDQSKVMYDAFTGVYGSTAKDYEAEWSSDGLVFHAGPFAPQEGLTIVVGVPKGIINKPTITAEAASYALDNYPIILVPLAAIGLMFVMWLRRGQDIGELGPVPVQYGPPEGLSPAEVGTIADDSLDSDDVLATLIDLAARGYLKIREVQTPSFLLFAKKDYEFVLLREYYADQTLKAHERRFLDGLFGGENSVLLSSLRNQFYTNIPKIREGIIQELLKARIFADDPEKAKAKYLGCGVALVMACFFLFRFSLQWAIGLGLAGIVIAISARFMPRKTHLGVAALRRILGFKEFVERVEKDRIEQMSKQDPTIFGRLLPFAMVLGVADQWAEAFRGLLTEPPSWYEGPYRRGYFDPDTFIHDLGRTMHTVSGTLRSSPSSAGSGGSGFGGGGFSGGGGGGGGGGSW